MYGVRDTFNRTKRYDAPELTRAMKAKRNAIAVLVVGGLALSVGLFMLITMTSPYVWIPVLSVFGTAGLFVFMITYGFALIEAGFGWIGEQFNTWKDAKTYGVRDE